MKYNNYKEQFKRLDKAINNYFFLEAMFIAYAIIEDRAESILSYEGNEVHSKGFVSINKKLNKMKKIAERKDSLPARYFSDALIDEILEWKEERNRLIHALMKAMQGSYSIKYVLPALFPDDPSLDYQNLEGVHNGGEASAAFASMANMEPEQLEEYREYLLKYCELDTYAMVKIWEKLRAI